MEPSEMSPQWARQAKSSEITTILHDPREEVLRALLENPSLEEIHVCILLGRKELSGGILEKIASDKKWMSSQRVRRAIVFHPNVSQTIGLQVVRELYAADLVQLALTSYAQPALRHFAEELVLARVPQLPPSQKLALARRGTPRIMGALLIDGSREILSAVLDSTSLNEGQVLKALARVAISAAVVSAIADHPRWSNIYSVRLAIVRNPQAPIARVLAFLPSISTSDLRILMQGGHVPSRLQPHIKRELAHRMKAGISSPHPRSG
jgi:hypothetical protein